MKRVAEVRGRGGAGHLVGRNGCSPQGSRRCVLPAAEHIACSTAPSVPSGFWQRSPAAFWPVEQRWGGKTALAQVCSGRNGGSVDFQEEGKPPGTFCLGKDLLIVPRIVVPQLIF